MSEEITTEEELKEVIAGLATKNPWLASCLEKINDQRLETHDVKALWDEMDIIDRKKIIHWTLLSCVQ